MKNLVVQQNFSNIFCFCINKYYIMVIILLIVYKYLMNIKFMKKSNSNIISVFSNIKRKNQHEEKKSKQQFNPEIKHLRQMELKNSAEKNKYRQIAKHNTQSIESKKVYSPSHFGQKLNYSQKSKQQNNHKRTLSDLKYKYLDLEKNNILKDRQIKDFEKKYFQLIATSRSLENQFHKQKKEYQQKVLNLNHQMQTLKSNFDQKQKIWQQEKQSFDLFRVLAKKQKEYLSTELKRVKFDYNQIKQQIRIIKLQAQREEEAKRYIEIKQTEHLSESENLIMYKIKQLAQKIKQYTSNIQSQKLLKQYSNQLKRKEYEYKRYRLSTQKEIRNLKMAFEKEQQFYQQQILKMNKQSEKMNLLSNIFDPNAKSLKKNSFLVSEQDRQKDNTINLLEYRINKLQYQKSFNQQHIKKLQTQIEQLKSYTKSTKINGFKICHQLSLLLQIQVSKQIPMQTIIYQNNNTF